MKRENIVKKLDEDIRTQKQLKKDDEEKATIDYCPGCTVAYCQGRYTTGQCE